MWTPSGCLRNVVERRFNLLKQWRDLATRYEKLAIVYRSAVVFPHRGHLNQGIVRHSPTAIAMIINVSSSMNND